VRFFRYLSEQIHFQKEDPVDYPSAKTTLADLNRSRQRSELAQLKATLADHEHEILRLRFEIPNVQVQIANMEEDLLAATLQKAV